MAVGQLPKSSSDPEISSTRPARPKFHHRCTNDRIREGSGTPPLFFSMTGKIRKDRKSVFREVGLDTEEPNGPYFSEHEFGEITGLASPTSTHRPDTAQGNTSDDGKDDTEQRQPRDERDEAESPTSPSQKPWYSRLTPGRRPRVRTASSAPPPSVSSFTRLSTIALLIAVVIPAFSYYKGAEEVAPLAGADAGVIYYRDMKPGPILETRADSPTKACKRWAHQSEHRIRPTRRMTTGVSTCHLSHLYLFLAHLSADNNLLVLDLTRSWDITSPSLRGLPQPSGPPAVSLGYLWNDYNNLYLYGGQFSDKPVADVPPLSIWRYSIKSQSWDEFKNPKTTAGNYSTDADIPLERAAEGAGISVPELGLSWYFGGHLDSHTTPGWSIHVPRLYLKSLLEFTHPGYVNDGLRIDGAGSEGAFRNITEGGLQVQDAFSERGDAALVFVPGWGERGILIGLAGGKVGGDLIDDLRTLDVFDIETSEWYHQETTGEAPRVRVNLCAVVASAPDASSFQIYETQTQYNDMYILSIPAFTWIKAPSFSSSSTAPKARAGHTCNLRDGQIIVLGGYTGASTPCESPGIWVFNASSLTWSSRFNSLDHPPDISPENSVLGASYGYTVPDPVAEVIGGSPSGGATVSQPLVGKPTAGPFATGKPPIWTLPGSTATVTAWGPDATSTVPPGSDPQSPDSNNSNNDNAESRKGGLIAAGVIAALAGLAALYLGYCAWLYRRQVKAYRSHLAVANRYSGPAGASTGTFSGLAAFFGGGRKGSKKSNNSGSNHGTVVTEKERYYPSNRMSTSTTDSLFATSSGAGGVEPRTMFDDDDGAHHDLGVPQRPGQWWRDQEGGQGSSQTAVNTTASGPSGASPGDHIQDEEVGMGKKVERRGSTSGESASSTERLLEGQEPSFFSVVMKPRRALRVVNGLEGEVTSA
ncbi:uncharacterized protein PODANS_6_9110 [Podospora anserina S mat+]|uniref:Podospora anserina S mat+ genomic DNA chromosome 6, supercontig 4 n=1 Tax=Podospora anserina (strain S / ATCC MYA-4624 / DSM 980 / FGSC 10383) TaxID=515849 RepID=B2AN64_PODAN|nr:uncharacterized protein PODANS_6_9110 [Podospora anserina S mat+]CAP65408.1 unnamed protein product [Podospora anserina S mat+]CDP31403.1 Putative protein of unknown function [Podospora anserina S mat+]